MNEIVIAVFTGIAISLFTSWITVKLSLKKYKTEKWWERKVEVYSKVIEALHNAKAATDKQLHAEYTGKKISDDEEKKRRASEIAANDEISKTTDIGSFFLSDEALSILAQYQQEIERASNQASWYDYLEADYKATDKCLKDIIKIAKKDLQTG